MELERKYCRLNATLSVQDGAVIEGYASLFGKTDRGGDIVEKGAYSSSLQTLHKAGRRVKMLWQHDPAEPIGIWDEVREDDHGLYVKGRLLKDVARAKEAIALIEAGAIEGLSIGYRTLKSVKTDAGQRKLLELELWEVSLVTFPMLPEARVGAKGESPADDLLRKIAAAIEEARCSLNPVGS
ncbi:MAG: HK97 family phage prohead protease [Boseongicola sp.]|nr:HK97 family phage prohead protease [Boseongicola sp.]